MLKIIIADDDSSVRVLLKKVLSEIPGVSEIYEANDGKQLLKLVYDHYPDVIFLDIEMPEINGIEAAKEIFDFNPKLWLIFATAYDCYSREAFEVYAFDYLIKPFNLQRIRRTMARIKEQKQGMKNRVVNQCPLILEGSKSKLAVQSLEGIKIINLADVIVITRIERKTAIYTAKDIITTNESLQQIEQQINNSKFFRCHKSYIVNVDMVYEIVPWGSKTFLAKLYDTNEIVLMTFEKAKEYKAIYCV